MGECMQLPVKSRENNNKLRIHTLVKKQGENKGGQSSYGGSQLFFSCDSLPVLNCNGEN